MTPDQLVDLRRAAMCGPDQLSEMARELQRSLEQAMREVAGLIFEGCAAGGGVTAVVDAWGDVRGVRISTLAKREIDNLTLGDAVVEAVDRARLAAEEAWRQRLAGMSFHGIPVDRFLPPQMGGRAGPVSA